jgi:hypothetical protein
VEPSYDKYWRGSTTHSTAVFLVSAHLRVFFFAANGVYPTGSGNETMGKQEWGASWDGQWHQVQVQQGCNVCLQDNVNPGLINPVYGCLIGGLSFKYQMIWLLEEYPLINKPWFINPGLTLHCFWMVGVGIDPFRLPDYPITRCHHGHGWKMSQ